MVNINLNIQKKDLWLLSAIMVFLVGVGFVISYNPSGTGGTPSIMGHSADEIEGASASFGAWTDQDSLGNTLLGNLGGTLTHQYQASGDGFLVVKKRSGAYPRIQLYVKFEGQGSFIEVYDARQNIGSVIDQSATIPIGKDDLFYITTDRNDGNFQIYWKPLGDAQLVKYNMPIQTMYTNIAMSRKRAFRTWDTATATITVRLNTASGQLVGGAVVRGIWSEGYSATVSGTTNANGQVSFTSDWIARTQNARFTINKITLGGVVENLAGELTDRI